jgi:hypothetical protein
VADSRRFPARADLEAWLAETGVGEVVVLLPAGGTVSRTCPLPLASDEQLEQAVQLQAEVHFGSVPAHRVGWGVLAQAAGEASRIGLVAAWPEAAQVESPATDAPVVFAVAAAALAALADGRRPDQPLVWVDRADGSVCLALSHAGGVALRSTRQDLKGDWQAEIRRLLAETALNASHGPDFIESMTATATARLEGLGPSAARLVLPEELIDGACKRLAGTPHTADWWSVYGLLAGAAMARAASLAGLTRLRHSLPVEHPGAIKRATAWLSDWTHAAWAIGACVALFLVWPTAASWLRLTILQNRHGDLHRQLAAVKDLRDKRAVYTALDRERWTMTKLLADLACSTPKGIELEQVRIDQGDAVAVRGTALPEDGLSAQQVVEKMYRQMQATDVFTKVSLEWGEETSYGKLDFSLSGEVSRPHKPVEFDEEQDFGRWTMRQRVHGEPAGIDDVVITPEDYPAEPASAVASAAGDGARPPRGRPAATPANATDPAAPAASPAAARERPPVEIGGITQGGGRGRSRSEGDEPGAPGIAPSEEVPPPMTQAQVDGMSKAEAMDMLSRVSKARKNAKASGNAELEARLKTDFEMLMGRIRRSD